MLLKKIGLILTHRPSIFVVLALTGAICLPQRASAQGFLGAVMSKQQDNSGNCTQPPSTSSFQTTDSAAWAWFAVSSAQSGDSASIQFFDPNNSPYPPSNYTVNTPGHTCFINTNLPISTAPAPPMTGTWTVRIMYNNEPLTTLTFTIGGSSPPSITTTSLPNGTAGTSYSASVAAIGGAPPLALAGWAQASHFAALTSPMAPTTLMRISLMD